jgi:hypothetical protein
MIPHDPDEEGRLHQKCGWFNLSESFPEQNTCLWVLDSHVSFIAVLSIANRLHLMREAQDCSEVRTEPRSVC